MIQILYNVSSIKKIVFRLYIIDRPRYKTLENQGSSKVGDENLFEFVFLSIQTDLYERSLPGRHSTLFSSVAYLISHCPKPVGFVLQYFLRIL